MKHRIAFAGFRHPHILGLLDRAKTHPDGEIVAAYESHAPTRDSLKEGGKVEITHTDFAQMLAESDATIIAIGDVYAKRGALAIAALESGRHVISDKPICTSLAELQEIERLSREKGLSVGCQLDLVEAPIVRKLHEIIREGTLGRICTITIGAQHPLRQGSRAAWYFEPGQHGGTINDIGIHAFDLCPWLTGSKWDSLLTAREWNAKASSTPHFMDCAQFHAVLEGQISCFTDVSYLAPDTLGYELPLYWRITVNGTKGVAEISYSLPNVTLVTDGDTVPQQLPGISEPVPGYLQDFLDEIAGKPNAEGITSARVLSGSRWALEAQALK